MNLIQLAESFGVSERTVEDWIREEDLPHIADRGRLLFDRAQVTTWAAAHGWTARTGFLASDHGPWTTGLALAPLLGAGGIWRDVPAAGVPELLHRIIRSLPGISSAVSALLGQRLRAPDGINWAPVGGGLALPHFSARVALGRAAGVIALVFLRDALPLAEPTPDGAPATRLFFFVPPSPRAHLDLLGRFSKALAQGPLRELVTRGAPDAEILAALAAADAAQGSATQLPKGRR